MTTFVWDDTVSGTHLPPGQASLDNGRNGDLDTTRPVAAGEEQDRG
jgi:hypothetical protein